MLHIVVWIISLNKMSNIRLEVHLPTGPVAQWIRHLILNQGIPGSSPGRVVLHKECTLVRGMNNIDETIKSSGPVA